MRFLNCKYLRKQNSLQKLLLMVEYLLVKGSFYMQKVYGFTNENVAAYPNLYNFDNAEVLSVLGSGDQYFISILAGAKDVTVFDVNKNAWYHFVLKFMAIRHLSYEEFWKFFIQDGLDNIGLYLEIREYLPTEVKKFFDVMRIMKAKFSSIKIRAAFMDSFTKEDYLKMLPYLNKENYYKLQMLLNNSALPKCIIKDFKDIAIGDGRKKYDLLLLSNIYHWMDIEPSDYQKLLDKFDPCIIQALYVWHCYSEVKEFEDLGFELTTIPPVKHTSFDTISNYVLTYKRIK